MHKHSSGLPVAQQTAPSLQVCPSVPSEQSQPPPAGWSQVAVRHPHVVPAFGHPESAQQTEPATEVVLHAVLFAAPGFFGSGASHVQPAVPVFVQLVV